MEWLQANYVEIFAAIGAVYVAARAVVALTPTPKDDAALERVGLLLRALAKLIGLDLKQGLEKKDPFEARRDGVAGVVLVLALSQLALGCAAFAEDPGKQYLAAKTAYVAAVDTATELRKAGKLTDEQVANLTPAIHYGRDVLNEWSAALKADEDYPDGVEVVRHTVATIRTYLLNVAEE